MSLIIESLDDSAQEKDIMIIVKDGLVLKYFPPTKHPIVGTSHQLQKYIKTSDLLTNDKIREKISQTMKNSEEINQLLAQNVKYIEYIQKRLVDKGSDPGNTKLEEMIKQLNQELLFNIYRLSKEIQSAEKEVDIYPAAIHSFYFCKQCRGFLAESLEFIKDRCEICKASTTSIEPKIYKYLDGKTINYFKGIWFEDYIAKIFQKMGWKTWCHGSVMGVSGILHPIDVMAIEPNKSIILMAECKTGKWGNKDLFSFGGRYHDITCNLGLFLSIQECPEQEGRSYIEKTPGLHLLDKLDHLRDEQVVEKINKAVNIL